MGYSPLDPQAGALHAWNQSFLAGLPTDVRDAILRDAVVVSVPAGSVINQPSGPVRIVLLHRGQVRVKVLSRKGRAATIRYARPGGVIGLPAAVATGAQETAEAVADCEASLINPTVVHRLASTDVRLAWLITQELARIMFDVVELLSEGLFDTVQQRVSRHLIDLAATSPQGLLVRVDQQELADSIGSVREVVARELKKLRAASLIERHPEGIKIIAPQQLQRIANGEPIPDADATTPPHDPTVS